MFDAVYFDHYRRIVRPVSDTAEEFFGVAPLTNGTAATCRRRLVNVHGYEWRRRNGDVPRSLQYAVPEGVTYAD
jgi:hypothetical protein